jgi:uncharacterized membrane protein SpoIIM required for sporulation
VLCTNGMMIGTIFGVCRSYHLDHRLLAFVAPHGVLELTSIFISGAAGLILARALLFPGPWRRFDALKIASKTSFALFGGCIPLLLLAGAIEGFISPRTDLPVEFKYLVSLATFICLFLYLFAPRNTGIEQMHKAQSPDSAKNSPPSDIHSISDTPNI